MLKLSLAGPFLCILFPSCSNMLKSSVASVCSFLFNVFLNADMCFFSFISRL
jgi:hypothetical protein